MSVPLPCGSFTLGQPSLSEEFGSAVGKIGKMKERKEREREEREKERQNIMMNEL